MKVPFWVLSSLGKRVELVAELNDGMRVWPVGSRGRLISVVAGYRRGSVFATMVFDDDRIESEENVALSQIRPVR